MPKGGKREGAGRPPLLSERLIRITISLTQAQVERLKHLGNDNVSAGVRHLLDKERSK
jgi:hypothetical protein